MADQSQNNQDKPQAPSFSDTLHTIFLAGVGAIAATGEKSSELFDQLVKKGEATVNQGKEKNDELLKKAKGKVSGTAEDALKAYLKNLSPEERDHFVASVQKAADDAGTSAQEVAQKVASGASDVAQELAAESAAIDVEKAQKSAAVSNSGDPTIQEDPKHPKDAPASAKE